MSCRGGQREPRGIADDGPSSRGPRVHGRNGGRGRAPCTVAGPGHLLRQGLRALPGPGAVGMRAGAGARVNTAAGCHSGGEQAAVGTALPRLALAGSPNAGKTSVFNALTGMHAKTGNYPGVTVSRFVGTSRIGEQRYLIEDLPGTYSMEPISPDEKVMVDVVDGRLDGERAPDALLVVLDATTLRRSLRFLASLLGRGLPTCVVVTFTDELAGRSGHLDVEALEQALGVPVVRVIGNRRTGIDR